MRPAQRARQRLKGRWFVAVTVQCTRLGAGLAVLAAELFALRLLNLGTDRAVVASALWQGGWLYGMVLLGMLLLDWLLVSPILAGQAAFYRRVAEANAETGEQEEKSGESGGSRSSSPSRRKSASADPSYAVVFSFFRGGYGRALRWRLGLFLRRLGWGTLCYAPAALIAGYAELVRRGGARTPLADMTMLLCTVFGLAALAGGFVVLEMLMLRYLPARYLLDDPEEKRPFRHARHIMKGRLGETIWLYLGFAGWLVSCVLLFPYFYAAPLFETTRALAVRYFRKKEASKTESAWTGAGSGSTDRKFRRKKDVRQRKGDEKAKKDKKRKPGGALPAKRAGG